MGVAGGSGLAIAVKVALLFAAVLAVYWFWMRSDGARRSRVTNDSMAMGDAIESNETGQPAATDSVVQTAGRAEPRPSTSDALTVESKATSVAGRVVDQYGTPIPHAQVEVTDGAEQQVGFTSSATSGVFRVSGGGRVLVTASTDDSGRFDIDTEGLDRGDRTFLSVSAPFHVPLHLSVPIGARDLDCVLDRLDGIVSGRVEGYDGQPVPGATVTISRIVKRKTGSPWVNTAYSPETSATLGADGSFEVSVVTSEWGYRLTCHAPGHVGPVVRHYVELPREPIRIVLAPACEVSGTVLLADGQPAVGANVALLGKPAIDQGETDEYGRFRFRPSSIGPGASLEIRHPAAVPFQTRILGARSDEVYRLDAAGTIGLRLEGLRLDLVGSRLTVWRRPSEASKVTELRARIENGVAYVHEIPPGLAEYRGVFGRWVTDWLPCEVVANQTRIVTATFSPIEPFSIVVVDSNEEPVSNARIWRLEPEPESTAAGLGAPDARTAPRRGYRGGVTPEYTHADGTAYSHDWVGRTNLFVIEREGHTLACTRALGVAGGRLEVRLEPSRTVTFEFHGSGAAQAEGAELGCLPLDPRVQMGRTCEWRPDGEDPFRARLYVEDAQVQISGLPDGDYEFYLVSGDGELARWTTRVAGPAAHRIEVVEPEWAEVTGRVLLDGAGPDRGRLSFLRSSPRSSSHGVSGPGGHFRLRIPKGDCEVIWTPDPGVPPEFGFRSRVTVDGSDLVIHYRSIEAAMRLIHADGTPVRAIGVVIESPLGRFGFSTDDEGRADLGRIPPGTYELTRPGSEAPSAVATFTEDAPEVVVELRD